MNTLILQSLLVCLVFSSLVWAQAETGQIVGTVTDPTMAAIAGAAVQVKSVEKQSVRQTISNENGNFTVANLLPGVYEITVSAQGFSSKTLKAQVTVGGRVFVEAELTLEQTGDVVEVTAQHGIQVNTENQTVSTTVTEKQIRELPTITRNPYDLVGLSGNISSGDPSGRGTGVAINGQRSSSTNVMLDGIDNNDNFDGEIGQFVPLDSVQEFSVISGDFSAEYGRASGGIVNVATKSGTNEFHGTAYEFNRISALASNGYANNANDVPKGVFTRNQFGFSVGGPIQKDKIFFFTNTELIRVRSTSPTIFLVPTPQLLAASSPATQAYFAAFPLQTPINSDVFTRSQVSAFLSNAGDPKGAFNRLPASLPAFGGVIAPIPADAGGGNPQDAFQTVARVDWNVNEKTSLYLRYAIERLDQFKGTISASPYQGFNTGETEFNNNVLLSVIHTLTPRLSSQSKIAANRQNDRLPLGDNPPSPELYATPILSRIAGLPITFPGYVPLDSTVVIPFGGPQNLLQINEDLTYSLGRHDLRFGGLYEHIRDNRTYGAFQGAQQALGNRLPTALDNFVLGQLQLFETAIDPQGKSPGDAITLPVSQPNFARSNRFHEMALYVNDSWNIHPNFKLSLGLRYEYFGVQHNANPKLDANFYFGTGNTLIEQIQNGRAIRASDSPVGGLYRKDLNNFAPRLGFAWDIFGNGETSLRGGYGIGYERNFGNVTFEVIQNPPNFAVVSLFAGQAGVKSLPITTNNAGPLAGSGTAILPSVNIAHVNQNIRTAYAHFWSVSLEHELIKDAVLSLTYSGSKGVGLYSLEDLNRVGSGAVYLGKRDKTSRINPLYGDFNTRGNNGFSNYHSLTVGLESGNLAKTGLHLTVQYTWSHTIDNLSSTFSDSDNNFNFGVLDPFNPKLDKGNADFDIRHRLVTSGVWEIPYFNKSKGLTGKLLDGWEVNYIFQAVTGTPFTIFDGSNANFIFPRLLQVGPLSRSGSKNPPPVTTEPNIFNYIDLSSQVAGIGAYVNPITGTSDFGPYPSGMTARNAFRGPGRWNLDFSLGRKVKFNEKRSLQFRFEMFNAFNHANLFVRGEQADISLQPFVPAFRDGRRQIQLGVKFLF